MNTVKMTIEEIADVKLGHAFRGRLPQVACGDCAVVQAKNIIGFSGELDNSFDEVLSGNMRSPVSLEAGDIVFSARGVFKAAVFGGYKKSTIASSTINILKIKDKNTVSPHYLAIFLNSDFAQKLLNVKSLGAGMKHISNREIREMEIAVPSMSVQKNIIKYQITNHEFLQKLEQKQKIINSIFQTVLTQTVNRNQLTKTT